MPFLEADEKAVLPIVDITENANVILRIFWQKKNIFFC